MVPLNMLPPVLLKTWTSDLTAAKSGTRSYLWWLALMGLAYGQTLRAHGGMISLGGFSILNVQNRMSLEAAHDYTHTRLGRCTPLRRDE